MSFDITDPGTFAILLGSLISLGVIDFSLNKRRFINNGKKTVGTIIDSYETSGIDSTSIIKIQFTDEEGNKITFTEQPLWSRGSYPISSEVDVIYNSEHPETAHINKNIFLWRWEFLFLVMGLGIVFVGFFGTDTWLLP